MSGQSPTLRGGWSKKNGGENKPTVLRFPALVNPAEKLLTAAELAELLGLKLSTIRQWTSAREIPSIKLGRRSVRYLMSDVLKAIGEYVEARRGR